MLYVEAIAKHLPRIREGGGLASVLEHCMYCGMSLGRVGLDFRGLLPPIFEACILELFTALVQVHLCCRIFGRLFVLMWDIHPSTRAHIFVQESSAISSTTLMSEMFDFAEHGIPCCQGFLYIKRPLRSAVPQLNVRTLCYHS